MKFAVIGTDISGMVAVYPLSRRHEVVVFKQDTPLSPQLIASFSPHRVEGTQAKTPRSAIGTDINKLT